MLAASQTLPADKPFGVIDIGSNSVRFVAYGGSTRSPMPIFNEKKFCRLGQSVVLTGRIEGDYWDNAMNTFKRFRQVSKRLGVQELMVVATAAVRQAENQAEFIEAAEQILNTDIAVLSGIEEAHYSALGVMMGFHTVDGLVADLGGGSLELARVVQGRIKEVTTLPIGVLALETKFLKNRKKIIDYVHQHLESVGWLKKVKNKPVYLVGGTWRALAEVDMGRRNSELRVLHHYKMPSKQIFPFLDEFAKKRVPELKKIKHINSQRRLSLPNAAIVLRELVTFSKCNMSLVSATGLREGLIYNALSEGVQEQDQLLSACREMSGRLCKDPEYGEELIAWTENIFAHTEMSPRKAESYERLRQAICVIADVAWSQHEDFRGMIAAETVLHSPFTGISHAGRCFMANAFLYRYNGSSSFSSDKAPRGFIPMRSTARKLSASLGLAIRLAEALSGAKSGLLMQTRVYQQDETLVLEIPKKYKHLIDELVAKRLASLAKMLKLEPHIEIIK